MTFCYGLHTKAGENETRRAGHPISPDYSTYPLVSNDHIVIKWSSQIENNDNEIEALHMKIKALRKDNARCRFNVYKRTAVLIDEDKARIAKIKHRRITSSINTNGKLTEYLRVKCPDVIVDIIQSFLPTRIMVNARYVCTNRFSLVTLWSTSCTESKKALIKANDKHAGVPDAAGCPYGEKVGKIGYHRMTFDTLDEPVIDDNDRSVDIPVVRSRHLSETVQRYKSKADTNLILQFEHVDKRRYRCSKREYIIKIVGHYDNQEIGTITK